MTKRFWLAAALMAVAVVTQAGAVQNLFRNPDFHGSFTDWEIIGKPGEFTANADSFTLNAPDVLKDADAGDRKLQQKQALRRGNLYRLYFSVDSELPQERFVVVSYRYLKKSQNLGVFARFAIHKGFQRICLEFAPGDQSEDPDDPSILSFYLGELRGKVTFSDLQLIDATTIKAERPPFSDKWKLFGLIDPAFTPGAAVPTSVPDKEGKPVKPVTITQKSNSTLAGSTINLRLEAGASRGRFKDTAMLYNEFDAPADALIPLGVSADWWLEARLNGKIVYSTMELGNAKQTHSPANHVMLLPVKKGKNIFSVKVMAGSEGWRFVWGTAQPPPEPIRFTAREGYLPIDMSHIVVQPGSALDLSGLLDAPAGKYGRAVIAPDGQIAFEKNPAPQRFFGFSAEIPENVWRNCSDQEYDQNVVAFAKAMRAQGYNLFRMHGIDQWLMAFSKEDFKPLPKIVDRWDRMIAELKKQGIYVQLDILAFWLFSSEKDWFQVAEARMAHKNMFILGRAWERDRFRRGAAMLLNHVNPYTGLAWKDEPAILAVEFYNELGLGIEFAPKMQRENPEAYRFLMDKWSGFLKKKYASLPAGKRTGDYSDASVSNPRFPPFWDLSPLRADYDEMWYENFKNSYDFCEKIVRDLGYKGLTLNCPMPALRETPASWEKLQVIDAHGYHAHPENGEQPGSAVDDKSSIGESASTFREKHGQRIYGRPFFTNEYNYVFRNPYQYESPIAYAAYAALNRWSSLAIHAGAVALKLGPEDRLHSFQVCNNPVLRAGEFMAAMFFLRRDVAEARHKVGIAVPKEYVFRPGISSRSLSPLQSRLCLLTDVSVICPGLPIPAGVPQPGKPDLMLRPAGAGDIVWHGWYATAVDGKNSGNQLADDIALLRAKGILPADNRTDFSKLVFESETGEILLRAKEKTMTLRTPRSEAVAIPAGKTEKLNRLASVSASVNALVGLTSVDGQTLADARRMVLVCSTRVANTGMEHEADNVRLRMIGKLPILMQSGKFDVTLRAAAPLRCYALRLDGARTEEIPVVRNADGGQRLAIDTAKLKHGPTPFFELTADAAK